MHSPSNPPHFELMTLLHSSLRSFQQRRDQRRSRYADPYTPPPPTPAPPHAPAPKRPAPAANFDAASDSLFGAARFIDVDGRAVAVMDPEFLQKLQDQMQGMAFVPPSMRFASAAVPSASPAAPPAANDVPAPVPTSAAVGTAAPPPEPGEPAPAKQTSTNAAPETQTGAPSIPSAPTTAAAGAQTEQSHSVHSMTRTPAPASIHASDDGARHEHLDLIGAILREHEIRLREQAEAAAAQQAALLRDVLASHRTQQDEQAARHVQVIRDLLREHQNQLDEHATAAVTREAQMVGTLLREHREALAEAREQHHRDLDEILEQHRGEMRGLAKAHAHDAGTTEMKQLRDLLGEHAKIQHAAHEHAREDLSTLAGMIEQIGEGTARLTFKLAQQEESWLPPPSFAQPPDIPAVPPMQNAPAGLAGVTPPVAVQAAPPPVVDGPAARLAVVAPLNTPSSEVREAAVANCTKNPSRSTATRQHENKTLARARIDDLIDAERTDDDDDDDDWPEASHRTRLAPLTPLEISEESRHG